MGFIILPTTHEVATSITPTLQMKKLRLKGLVSDPQCKSQLFCHGSPDEDEIHTIRKARRLCGERCGRALKDV